MGGTFPVEISGNWSEGNRKCCFLRLPASWGSLSASSQQISGSLVGQKSSYLFVCGGIWGLVDVTTSEFSILLMSLLLTVTLTS